MIARRDLIRAEDIAQLEANWIEQEPLRGTRRERDFKPVVRLYLPFTSPQFQWLLTEKEPGSDLLFGLCQLFEAELGYVSFVELREVQHPQGLRVLQDISFASERTIGQWATLARENGGILPG